MANDPAIEGSRSADSSLVIRHSSFWLGAVLVLVLVLSPGAAPAEDTGQVPVNALDTPAATQAPDDSRAPQEPPVAAPPAGDQPVEPSPATAVPGLVADGLDVVDVTRIEMMANQSRVLRTRQPYGRVSVADPEVVEFNALTPTSILLTARQTGTTQVVVWDDEEREQVLEVVVGFDLRPLQSQLEQIFPGVRIEASMTGGAILLRGQAPNLAVAEQAGLIAGPHAEQVMNFIEVAGGQQVMLQVRFAEVSRTASTALGINGAFAHGSVVGGSNIGQINPTNFLPEGGPVGISPRPQGFMLQPREVSPAVTVYGAGQIGSFYLETFVQALRQNNLLRILAEPNLITTSGEEASFLAGGEFPIPVAQAGAAAGAISVEFREFGVRLSFRPVVLGDGRIRLHVVPEVSELDFASAVVAGGFQIPGLSKRRVSTTVELADGQTFAIAGLLNQSTSSSKLVTPLLGDLPVVGVLFRSVRYQRRETELVVLVTPRLVGPLNPGQVPALPGERWRDPTEPELFFRRDLGQEVTSADTGPPPQYYGRPGFQPPAK